MIDEIYNFDDTELVIGIVAAVGTDINQVTNMIKNHLKKYNYDTEEVKLSSNVIKDIFPTLPLHSNEFQRINMFMDYGDEARKKSKNNAILALGAVNYIDSKREKEADSLKYKKRTAYIINSLKHPEEVKMLRKIYQNGFYLVGVYCDEERRKKYLTSDQSLSHEEAEILIKRDKSEIEKHGQQTRDTFQLSDFFITSNGKEDQLKNSVWRIFDLIFGDPFLTPTFEEFAMFTAFTSSLRSADLSRQVGSAIANNKNEIISMGANDCPKYGGGLYWPSIDDGDNEIVDAPEGRDYKRGFDSNKKQLHFIIDDFLSKVNDEDIIEGIKGTNIEINISDIKEKLKIKIFKSEIKNITEYGRVVHAEMEALLMCARNNISTKGATLYCTTFPCHNCAKHIIDAGLDEVVYVEPYPKSHALDFHNDSISTNIMEKGKKVVFRPFVGIGPRRFYDLFSMTYGSGYEKIRKNENGEKADWKHENGTARMPLIPVSYIDIEMSASSTYEELKRSVINAENDGKEN